MDTNEYWQMLQHGLDRDGLQFVLDTLQEECAELIVAISHLRRGRVTVDEVVEEMADVRMMTDMAKLGLVGELEFRHVIFRKAVRLGKRIKWSNNNGDERIKEPVQVESRTEVVDRGHYEESVRSRSHISGDGYRAASARYVDLLKLHYPKGSQLSDFPFHANDYDARFERSLGRGRPIQSQEREHVHGGESKGRGDTGIDHHAGRHPGSDDLSGSIRRPTGPDPEVSGIQDSDNSEGAGLEDS